tara:strand:+ start:149 stop:328 length:180 start_codon:yes stop_codon:yes gene_type:complete
MTERDDRFTHSMDGVIWINAAGDRINPHTGEALPVDLKDRAAVQIDEDGNIIEKREDLR